MVRSILTLVIALSISSNLYSQTDLYDYENKTYDTNIRTVQLYPNSTIPGAQLLSPVIGLNSAQTLMLEFDELYQDEYTYQAKIVHCNADWTPSGLSPLQYLTDYNEFIITNAEYSFGTLTPYVHYTFEVPRPIISGNYLLVIYADGDPEDVIITRRFMVFEQWVNISNENEIRNRGGYSLGKQELQFDIRYSKVELLNPMVNTSVSITQNQRWDNVKSGIRPTFAKESQRVLEYNHFAGPTTFDAGNEFRQFDIRSLRYFGFHVASVKFEKDGVDAWVEQDKPRADLAYTLEQNNNGQFFIENLERKIPDIENDYALVHFSLQSENANQPIYLSGAFTNWGFFKENRLAYNKNTKAYEGTFLLKQGQYDYQYLLAGKSNANTIEGSKSDTRNIYEIFFYYRSPTLMADLLIGYQRVRLGGL
jgi:hypothetical protein